MRGATFCLVGLYAPAIAADDPAELFDDPDRAMAFRLSVEANLTPPDQQVDLAIRIAADLVERGLSDHRAVLHVREMVYLSVRESIGFHGRRSGGIARARPIRIATGGHITDTSPLAGAVEL